MSSQRSEIRRTTFQESINKEAVVNPRSNMKTTNANPDILSTRFTLDLQSGTNGNIYSKLKQEASREKQSKNIMTSRVDAEKTLLKGRCNRIINQILYRIDPNLV